MALSSLAGASLGPAISSKLMEYYAPWIAALTSLFINLLSLVPLLFVPETLSTAKDTESIDHDAIDSEQSEPNSFGYYISRSFKSLLASFSLLKSYSLIIVLSTFLTIAPEIMGTSQFMAQYISKRFGWSLAEAGYLLTLRGAIHLCVLLLILPLLSKILLRYCNATTKDLILARGSIAFAGVGIFLMAAPQIGVLIGGLAVHSLGSGLAPLCRSLATSYVAQEDTSKLNTIIGIVEMVGSLFAGPVLAWSFDLGMRMGGIGLGLPYFGLAGSFALCLIGLCFVQSPRSEDFIVE
ncbi:Major facilitator superfamily domain general substrate transporter [Penicillium herquei]|nr:Major facilitator superfamily domain general substrate transporter [Penicillium herquei]